MLSLDFRSPSAGALRRNFRHPTLGLNCDRVRVVLGADRAAPVVRSRTAFVLKSTTHAARERDRHAAITGPVKCRRVARQRPGKRARRNDTNDNAGHYQRGTAFARRERVTRWSLASVDRRSPLHPANSIRPQYMHLPRLRAVVDYWIQQLEPLAVRVARETEENRHIGISPLHSGVAEIWGDVRASHAVAFDRRLEELAATVCPADPRTKAQRRADAFAALAARASAMPCACGSPDCPATKQNATAGDVVIHVLAESATVGGDSTAPGYVPGFGGLSAEAVQQLATSAKLPPVVHPKDAAPEPRYRPSAALADFIRCRDLTCRFPDCDRPAEHADIDHTVPWPLGPTHTSNLKLLCRIHNGPMTFRRVGRRGDVGVWGPGLAGSRTQLSRVGAVQPDAGREGLRHTGSRWR